MRYSAPSGINLWSGISTIYRRMVEGSIKDCWLFIIFHSDIGRSCREISGSLFLDFNEMRLAIDSKLQDLNTSAHPEAEEKY